MSRKQVVLLTSIILLVALITNMMGLIQDAEAHVTVVLFDNVTHSCVDTDHPYQSDICQTVTRVDVTVSPMPHGHVAVVEHKNSFESTGVTSCSQCPNPPFTNYN